MNLQPTRESTSRSSSQLLDKRTEAALASGGTSSGPIHDAALTRLEISGRHGDLLEFGAGTGNLLSCLLDKNWSGQMTGADILPRPANLPESVHWIQQDLNSAINLPDNSFDLILSTEVIEHLENPRAIAREFARLLRPGGLLVLTTPNQESVRSLLSLLLTGHYVAFQDSCYPAHITALLRKDLRRIFTEAGFEAPEFTYTNWGGLPKLPRITWQQMSFSRLRGRLFSDNLVMETRLADSAG